MIGEWFSVDVKFAQSIIVAAAKSAAITATKWRPTDRELSDRSNQLAARPEALERRRAATLEMRKWQETQYSGAR